MVKYTPTNSPEKKLPYVVKKNHLRLKSTEPLKCYGDSTVLSKLKLPKTMPGETLIDMLGPIGEHIPATFKRVDKLAKHFADKYKQKGE